MVKESKKKAAGDLQSAEQEAQQELDEEEAKTGITAYDYLLNMPIMSLTLERVNTLQAERDSKDQELGALRSTSSQPALSIPASLTSCTKCPLERVNNALSLPLKVQATSTARALSLFTCIASLYKSLTHAQCPL